MLEHLLKSPSLGAFARSLKRKKDLVLEQLWDAPKASIVCLLQRELKKNILLLTGQSSEEMRMFHDFTLFTQSKVHDFPAWETLPQENISPNADIVGQRYEILRDLSQDQSPCIVICNLQAALQRLLPQESFLKLCLDFLCDRDYDFQSTVDTIVQMGYRRCPIASDKGEFALRGGIIDIFPVNTPDPYRLDFFGDTLESIRMYDPVSQKSIEKKEKLRIAPALELELLQREKTSASILSYLGDDTLVLFDGLLAIEDRYAALKKLTEKKSPIFYDFHEFFCEMQDLQKVYFTQQALEELSPLHKTKSPVLGVDDSSFKGEFTFEFFQQSLQAQRWHLPFSEVKKEYTPSEEDKDSVSGYEILQNILQKQSYEPPLSLHLIFSSDTEKNQILTKFSEKNISLPKDAEKHKGYLSSGFMLCDHNIIVFPSKELTGRTKIRRQKLRGTTHFHASEVMEFLPGDYVVHIQNGVGKYQGMEYRSNHAGIQTEFFSIEYADNTKLYVPLTQAHLLSKYVGVKEEKPHLHKLGSNRWHKTLEKTEQALVGYAADLLHLYSLRKIKGGFCYPQDSQDICAFEEEFPFVETEDQLSAISSIKEDMTSFDAMDRLVCGDVGYGKTEVAMRAAFKAVLDGGKQVALLVPTTILAMQHYETFSERMSNFAVQIGIVSRFQTPKQCRQTLQDTREHKIDILIGTHRILSDDVQFEDLGLIIIDEEQRFGVRAKEKLKKLKVGVDCLTLSATPIPRTLYSSLIGIRNMSQISTPPQDRLPIKTIICEARDHLIQTALLRELNRDGQAYYIHNRVESIHLHAKKIQALVPQARILVAHGQMSSHELDRVFHGFKMGQADILVATTIVESGIDIPNANTILIERSDCYGLSDLYQLRGRVGRWNRPAYAYFLTPVGRKLRDLSKQRLEALLSAGNYGGGMKIAMRDLEIRGAGDMLGTKQSGHIASVGFHLYCKLLKQTIDSLNGKKMPTPLGHTKVEFPINAKLPEDYVNETCLRLEIYQRLGEAQHFEEIDTLMEEIRDRFGPPPEPVRYLYHITRIRLYAAKRGISILKMHKHTLSLEKKKGTKIQKNQVFLAPIQNPKALEKKVKEAIDRSF